MPELVIAYVPSSSEEGADDAYRFRQHALRLLSDDFVAYAREDLGARDGGPFLLCGFLSHRKECGSGPLPADAPCQLQVLRHNGHALGMDRAQVGVLEEPHEVGLGGLLERQDGGALEPEGVVAV